MNPLFAEMLAATGDDRFANLPAILEGTPPEVSVRLNPRKPAPAPDLPVQQPVAWCPTGHYLAERPRFTLDPALHQGRYYVQDASSMILSAVAARLSDLTGNVPLLWLDACAAPGGKTTAAIASLPEGSLVVANEYDYQRAEILKENVAKWGSPDTVITRGDTARYRKLPALFDVVAVDAPCSGEGMMRKDPVAREQWTPALVGECAARQREILANLWEALRPGGYLVYSTCTFNTVENEEMVRWMIDNHEAAAVDLGLEFPGIDHAVNLSSGTDAVGCNAGIPAMRFIPGRARGEGLFLSVLRKPGEFTPAAESLLHPGKGKKQKGKGGKPAKPGIETRLADWLLPEKQTAYSVIPGETSATVFPSLWLPLLPKFEKTLDVIAKGVELCEVKGKDIIPTQQLALSTILSLGAFPTVEVTKREAQLYLAREAVTLPADTPRGIVLLTYQSLPLGFAKHLGNRSNNLYPKEWRIKHLSPTT